MHWKYLMIKHVVWMRYPSGSSRVHIKKPMVAVEKTPSDASTICILGRRTGRYSAPAKSQTLQLRPLQEWISGSTEFCSRTTYIYIHS